MLNELSAGKHGMISDEIHELNGMEIMGDTWFLHFPPLYSTNNSKLVHLGNETVDFEVINSLTGNGSRGFSVHQIRDTKSSFGQPTKTKNWPQWENRKRKKITISVSSKPSEIHSDKTSG